MRNPAAVAPNTKKQEAGGDQPQPPKGVVDIVNWEGNYIGPTLPVSGVTRENLSEFRRHSRVSTAASLSVSR